MKQKAFHHLYGTWISAGADRRTGKKMRQKNYRKPGGKRNKDFRGTRRAGNQGRKADRVHIGRFGSADLRERGDDGIRDPVSLL